LPRKHAFQQSTKILAGGLMSYGGDLRENYREGAVYVDRILKGARPTDPPVIQASRFELVLNKGAAKALGLTIPDTSGPRRRGDRMRAATSGFGTFRT
jgi:putative ABC transport system substrate-binding protein